jgi:hypothetical protein
MSDEKDVSVQTPEQYLLHWEVPHRFMAN